MTGTSTRPLSAATSTGWAISTTSPRSAPDDPLPGAAGARRPGGPRARRPAPDRRTGSTLPGNSGRGRPRGRHTIQGPRKTFGHGQAVEEAADHVDRRPVRHPPARVALGEVDQTGPGEVVQVEVPPVHERVRADPEDRQALAGLAYLPQERPPPPDPQVAPGPRLGDQDRAAVTPVQLLQDHGHGDPVGVVERHDPEREGLLVVRVEARLREIL